MMFFSSQTSSLLTNFVLIFKKLGVKKRGNKKFI